MTDPAPATSWTRLRVAAFVAAAAALALLLAGIVTAPARAQWDFRVYYQAAKAAEAGLDPYGPLPDLLERNTTLRFVYPPLLLRASELFALLPYRAASLVFLGLKTAALVALVRVLQTRFLRDPRSGGFALWTLVALGGAMWMDMRAGNVATFEQLALWIGFAALVAGRLTTFCVCVVAAAACKLVPVVFLAMLLLSPDPRRFRFLVGGAAAFAASVGIQAAAWPGEFRGFLGAATGIRERGAEMNPSTAAAMSDLADWARDAFGLGAPRETAAILTAVVTLVVLAATFRALRGRRLGGADDVTVVCLVAVTAALVLPRFKIYSHVQLLLPAWIAMHHVARGRTSVLVACWAAACVSDAGLPGWLLQTAGADLSGAATFWRYLPLGLAAVVWITLVRKLRSGVSDAATA